MENINELVYQACVNANIDVFTRIVKNIKNAKQKQLLEEEFKNHMKYVSNFILNSDFWKTWKLDENFIKQLHKIHYPPNYVETKKNKKWEDIVFMVPGEYKKYPNFLRVSPSIVNFEMDKWVKKYNKNIWKVKDKQKIIWELILEFFKIHPFWHGNWMMASLLFDLMLIKNNLKPIWLKAKYLDDNFKSKVYKSIEKSIKENNTKYFLETIFSYYSNEMLE